MWVQSPSHVSLKQTLYLASPSLQWVAWTSLPHLPVTGHCLQHRYYCPLRLPKALLGFVPSSVSSPDTLFAPLLSLAGQVRAYLLSARTMPHRLTGTLNRFYLQGDSWLSPVPELPLWIHALLLDPGGDLHTCHNAFRSAAFQPLHAVGFYYRYLDSYPMSTTIHFSGLNHTACILVPSGFGLSSRS